MAEKVYPSSKTSGGGGGGGGSVNNPSFPATKAQMYNAARPTYRPQPRSRSRRSCLCACCVWTTVLIVVILLLAAIAGAILWVVYRPHRPAFSVSSLQVSQFNFTSPSSKLTSKFNLAVNARNPNKKLVFFYDPISVSIIADGVDVGDGSLPAFVHGTKNTSTLKTTIASTAKSMESASVTVLKSDLKNKMRSLPIKIELDSKVKVKIGGLKTKGFRVRITCQDISVIVSSGKTATPPDSKCKFDLRIKIWKWTF